ncbi:DUF2141 domain-containing protein [Neolewinella antarctica]|uniref:Uncharacterized protein (DUF2141 family) n=1 Tax=Neolewinella antarctica TaxID=442734 RepID=A0ABX0XEP4_9BACT|nr:DUF2141 domain-containing protein [Neolewinella antarctica]NJC27789.1 uncharacterized protein (DUF2141 family) [Neolewinella antarctica]
MRNLFLSLSFLLCCTAMSGAHRERVNPAADPPTTRTIHLRVSNVKVARGMIWVGIYEGDHDFMDREKARIIGVNVEAAGDNYLELPDMVVNQEYALAVFHDVDNDGDMNRNWLGLPSEPWAFTGEAKTRLRLPTFSEVKFRVTESLGLTSLSLRMY